MVWSWLPRRTWDAALARAYLLGGGAEKRMRVRGTLDLSGETTFRLPSELEVETLRLVDCAGLRRLPRELSCHRLDLSRSAIAELPDNLRVRERIDARECRQLVKVARLNVQRLNLAGCSSLRQLPSGLRVRELNLSGCYRLENLPNDFGASLVSLCLRDCARITQLPGAMGRLEQLDVRGCRRLESLPEGFHLRSSIDVAGSGIQQLPWSLRSVRVLWNGVTVSDRVAFSPQSITIDEILEEPNPLVRRVLLERVGYEWFVDHAPLEVIDQDSDAGGPRRLLRIRLDGGEDYCLVEVHCPSTGHRYLLRVPPQVNSCQQAVAWTAGYSIVHRYQPVQEA